MHNGETSPKAFRPGLLLALYGVCVLAVLLAYFDVYPLPELSSKLQALAGFAFLMFGCLGAGAWLAKRAGLFLEVSYADWPLCFALGAGGFSMAVLLVAWLPSYELSLKFFALAGCLLFFAARFTYSFPWRTWVMPRALSMIDAFLIAGVLFGNAVVLLSSFSPITYYDSLVYHLALPSIYSHAGRIVDVPHNLYSFFPAGMEAAFLFILQLFPEPEYVINLFGWAFSFFLSIGIALLARRIAGSKAALVSIFLWWTTPAVLLLSNGGYVDIPLALYTFTAIVCFLQARERNWNPSWLAASGLFGGFSYAVKYTGAVVSVLLAISLVWKILRERSVPFSSLILYGTFFLIPVVPWLLKNFLSIGNPVFPFFYRWLGGHEGWTGDAASRYFLLLTEYGSKSHLLADLFLSPWHLSTAAMKFGGGFDVLGDFGWPLFIFSAPLALFTQTTGTAFLTIYAVAHFIFWFLTKPVFRFLVPVLPVFVVLSAVALTRLLSNSNRRIAVGVATLVLPWLASHFFLYFLIASELEPFSVALGRETKQQYLSRRLSFYDTFAFANANLGMEERVLLIGEQRTYHLDVPFLTSNLFAVSPVSQAANGNPSMSLKTYLIDNKITHILTNESEIDRLGGWRSFGFDEKGGQAMAYFLTENCSQIFEKHRVKLYRINY